MCASHRWLPSHHHTIIYLTPINVYFLFVLGKFCIPQSHFFLIDQIYAVSILIYNNCKSGSENNLRWCNMVVISYFVLHSRRSTCSYQLIYWRYRSLAILYMYIRLPIKSTSTWDYLWWCLRVVHSSTFFFKWCSFLNFSFEKKVICLYAAHGQRIKIPAVLPPVVMETWTELSVRVSLKNKDGRWDTDGSSNTMPSRQYFLFFFISNKLPYILYSLIDDKQIKK